MVKYATPQAGDLIFIHKFGPLASGIEGVEIIGAAERGEHLPTGIPVYYHCAVYVGGGLIIEALGRGLTVSSLSKYNGMADVYSAKLSVAQRDEIISQAWSMHDEGFAYSYFDIAVQFMRLIFRLHIPWRQKHSVICSVFAWDCWAAAGVYLTKHRNVSPEDLVMGGVLRYQGRLAGGVA